MGNEVSSDVLLTSVLLNSSNTTCTNNSNTTHTNNSNTTCTNNSTNRNTIVNDKKIQGIKQQVKEECKKEIMLEMKKDRLNKKMEDNKKIIKKIREVGHENYYEIYKTLVKNDGEALSIYERNENMVLEYYCDGNLTMDDKTISYVDKDKNDKSYKGCMSFKLIEMNNKIQHNDNYILGDEIIFEISICMMQRHVVNPVKKEIKVLGHTNDRNYHIGKILCFSDCTNLILYDKEINITQREKELVDYTNKIFDEINPNKIEYYAGNILVSIFAKNSTIIQKILYDDVEGCMNALNLFNVEKSYKELSDTEKIFKDLFENNNSQLKKSYEEEGDY